VHVWRAWLAADGPRREALASHLCAAERERAARFRFERDAARYAVARGTLRELLARYTGEAPAQIALAETDHGRPYLAGARAPGDLDFNLTHSQDLALFAFCRGARIGVDLEKVQPLEDMDDLVGVHFSARERETYRSLAPRDRERAFFDCWTRKEAFVKAIGEGLSHPLDAFDVSFRPDEPPRLLRLASAPRDLERWSLHALRPADGYAAAVAVERPAATLRCYDVPRSAS
jgi:4'-phosphopantetheinyl transferase